MEAMQKLLQEFGEQIGIQNLKFDEDGYCCLLFDEICINIEMSSDTEQLYFNSPLGSIPENSDQSFCEMLLEANYFFVGTGGGTLAMNRKADIIQLLYRTPYNNLDIHKVESIIENLINISETWIGKIKSYEPSEKKDTSDSQFDLSFRV